MGNHLEFKKKRRIKPFVLSMRCKIVFRARCISTCHLHNKNIAAVGHTGVISGIFNGSATITVSYTEGDVTKGDTVDVNVIFDPVCDT